MLQTVTEEEIAEAGSATNGGQEDEQHLGTYLNAMFSYVGMKHSSYRMKCLLCLPKDRNFGV